MEVGVLTVPLYGMSLKEAVDYLEKQNIKYVELGTGGFPGNTHCNPEELLKDEVKFQDFQNTLAEAGICISGLACHGNPVHPDAVIAAKAHREYERTLQLAQKLGVEKVITFSGCPGDSPGSSYPNWVTCAWPDDYQKILEYQWEKVLIPYWKKAAELAKRAGVKVCLEMHPGFCVYNPETLLKLRSRVGDTIGANFDPSHLLWQGIDPVAAIRKLGEAIFYVHMKDTYVDKVNAACNGVLDTKNYGDIIHRSWTFRTVGFGTSEKVWKDIVSELRLAGFDGVLSIEHEDAMMSIREGLEKAIAFTKSFALAEMPGAMWWA